MSVENTTLLKDLEQIEKDANSSLINDLEKIKEDQPETGNDIAKIKAYEAAKEEKESCKK